MGTSLYEQHQAAQEPGGSLYEQYLKSQGKPSARESLRLDIRAPSESTSALPYDKDRPGDLAALKSAPAGLRVVAPDAMRGAAALTLSAAQGIPGVEAFEAAAGSVGSQFTDHPMGFREARDVLRAETDKIPGEVRIASQVLAGGGAARALSMLSPAKAGAVIGATGQALDADDETLAKRATDTVIGGAGGAAAGKVLETIGTLARSAKAPSIDKNIASRSATMRAADRVNYGRAETEGAAAQASAAVKNVLQREDIKPFADMVRQTRQFANADDATVLRETFKLMSRQQTGLSRQLKRDGFDAAKQLQHDNIGLAKQELLAAADNVMPSFRGAVQSHAKDKAAIDAVRVGKQAATRMISKTSSANPETQSAQALTERISRMSPAEKQAAIEGILGRLRETVGLQPNAVSLGGTLTTAMRPARVTPYLRQLGGKDQQLQDELTRMALMLGAGIQP